MTDEVEDILEHFGVKGMKWGIRRERLRVANAEVNRTKAHLTYAKQERSEARKDMTKTVLGVGAVSALAVGGAVTFIYLQKGGAQLLKTVKQAADFKYTSTGKNWLGQTKWKVGSNNKAAFDITMAEITRRGGRL